MFEVLYFSCVVLFVFPVFSSSPVLQKHLDGCLLLRTRYIWYILSFTHLLVLEILFSHWSEPVDCILTNLFPFYLIFIFSDLSRYLGTWSNYGNILHNFIINYTLCMLGLTKDIYFMPGYLKFSLQSISLQFPKTTPTANIFSVNSVS